MALITGAASGIGRALALRLAARGQRLMLHGRAPNSESGVRLEAVAVQCLDAGAAACTTVYAELGEESAAARVLDAVRERYGALDHLVANAGYARQSTVASSSWASLGEALAVMPMSFAALLRESRALLRASHCARVVALSSFVAQRFDRDALFFETAAAKAALEALAKSAAAEFAADHITVNCVAPGFTQKDRPGANQAAWSKAVEATPLGTIALPDQIAALIDFLLSRDAAHITGTVLAVDGGLTLL